MVRHDDESVQEELPVTAIVENSLLQQLRRSRNLKKAAALGRHSGNQIRPGFLGREPHLSRIDERPVAKATTFLRGCIMVPEGSCSIRNPGQRSPPSANQWGYLRFTGNTPGTSKLLRSSLSAFALMLQLKCDGVFSVRLSSGPEERLATEQSSGKSPRAA
jgi:hypothetical protein